jgi:hypothetical protein
MENNIWMSQRVRMYYLLSFFILVASGSDEDISSGSDDARSKFTPAWANL